MAKHRTRVYEIEDIDEEAIADVSATSQGGVGSVCI